MSEARQPPNNRQQRRKKNSDSNVDLGGVMNAGKAKIKKKIRDIERKMKKFDLPSDVKINYERALKALRVELEEKDLEQKAREMAKKYHMVKFFEKKKALRKYKQALKAVQELEQDEKAEKKDLKKAKKVLRHCEVDLAYVANFPRVEKYVSLYPNDNAVNTSDPNVKKGLLETEKKRQYYKKQVEKMMDDGSLPVKIADIVGGVSGASRAKPRAPESGSAGAGKAIDAPEDKKQEEDEFFD